MADIVVKTKLGEYVVKEGLLYTESDEWIKIEGDTVTIGITDYAQKSLHEIVYVELPEIGKVVRQMDVLGSVESIKAVSDIYAPISGEVIEVNEKLNESPELLNTNPYGEGWVAKLKPTNLEEDLKNLMNSEQYEAYLKELERE